MRVAFFYHSIVSDWNHGNAHFLRGVARELVARGHTVSVFEPRDGWSLRHLTEQYGTKPLEEFRQISARVGELSRVWQNGLIDEVSSS